MNTPGNPCVTSCRGLVIRFPGPVDAARVCQDVLAQLQAQDLLPHVLASAGHDAHGACVNLRLDDAILQAWAPGCDTLQLAQTLHLDTEHRPDDLTREIVVAMLMGPVAFEFPSVDELLSAVRIRHNIVQAARKTTLAFHTSEAERPEDCWTYDEDRGFVIRPDASLITALTKATQPEVSGALYSFSCYRASEYVIVLGIAQELEVSNPALLQQLQTLWTQRPIRSGEFHEVFLREQGSMEAPLPPHYFVPGDRTWFRNPDEASAEASGFEGSWVMYLGGGLFTNFWKRDQPYTLMQKCLEIYHWRHGLYRDAEGEERIDEDKVALCIEATLQQPAELRRIMAIMERYREARGIYTDAGGCIDTTREFARWVRPGTADLVLPAP
ncbi:MAG: hypothetical protein WA174_02070 [Rhodoferax sp.]